jgi:hypothetical protein
MDGQTTNPDTTQPVPIGVPLPAARLTVTALPANTGTVAVGHGPDTFFLVNGDTYASDGPDATNGKGILLDAGDSITLKCKVVSEWWLSVATADEGVAWSAEAACCSGCEGASCG